MTIRSTVCLLLAGVLAIAVAPVAMADPCGMVPPIYTGDGPAIQRVGIQKTYVFFRDGVETFVIRPGFTGKVDNFGMLIPFPSVPAMRKVDDAIFSHIAAAIDPPEVVVDLTPYPEEPQSDSAGTGTAEGALRLGGRDVEKEEVRVLKQEAIGMYEVVVLAAGSPAALKKWMDDHGYHYPTGMDKPCGEYVAAGWCFVAVKTRVSGKAAVDPRAGMRDVQPGLGPNGTFDGNVQAMGFRFRVPQLVVPMRLSSFNAGELHNIVYLLTEQPMSIRNTPTGHVRRQVSGVDLHRNVTQLLPLRIVGGTAEQIGADQRRQIDAMRDPAPYNSLARELFAFDLLASVTGNLAHPHEEREKELLNIGERLDLRGPEIDALNHDALADLRKKAGESALQMLRSMTLTVWDGDFDRDMLGRENLSFVDYRMDGPANTPVAYNAIIRAELGDWQERFDNSWSWGGNPALRPAGERQDGTLTRAALLASSSGGDGEAPPAGSSEAISTRPAPADAGPPASAIPAMTLVWLAMGGSALLLTLALLAFGLRPRPKG